MSRELTKELFNCCISSVIVLNKVFSSMPAEAFEATLESMVGRVAVQSSLSDTSMTFALHKIALDSSSICASDPANIASHTFWS
ncbi:hypothetical protein PybrP1_005667 [[Pythium] brassicae (nom. inval.)]|nr:hypothetical protein PybrP1_005667 [[Pythium] brassicae (nom. inval.)]